METIRKFKKMGLWDFIELMQQNCYQSGKKEVYFLYLDELNMRRIESISEGGNYKLQALGRELLAQFEKEIDQNRDFIAESEELEFRKIIEAL
ncbi:MAG: hypothetical protein HN509_16550 [Halobacteriovoraceae bacterium]|jgi:hypothetical protein|nr:hypothetical protein [Halobacteriovoraceae bacterium]MBT5092821.1 hypothetical protein [Halobacteriovoraceae bacterium]